MVADSPENFRLTVLSPGGRDPEQQFHGVPAPDEGAHPPINFHAFAACTFGAFHRDTRRALDERTPVLLLLRSDFRAPERALTELKREGRTVAVSLKETGLHQIAHQLRDPAKLSRFMKIVANADGCIATTPDAVGADQRWDFSILRNKQSGIFVGTREWGVPSRNHFTALMVARQLSEATGEPVTAVNLDGYRGRRLLGELNFPKGKLRLIEKWKAYPDYLRDVASNKIVLQLDRSHVPGQVAGDALLCRIPCVGGDGAIERIAFPKTCGEGKTISEIASTALNLLKNAELRAAVVAESQELARERLSFEAVRSQLANWFANAQGTSAIDP